MPASSESSASRVLRERCCQRHLQAKLLLSRAEMPKVQTKNVKCCECAVTLHLNCCRCSDCIRGLLMMTADCQYYSALVIMNLPRFLSLSPLLLLRFLRLRNDRNRKVLTIAFSVCAGAESFFLAPLRIHHARSARPASKKHKTQQRGLFGGASFFTDRGPFISGHGFC